MGRFCLKPPEGEYRIHRGMRYEIIKPSPVNRDIQIDDSRDECDMGDPCDTDFGADFSEPLEPAASDHQSLVASPKTFGLTLPCTISPVSQSTSALIPSSPDSSDVIISGIAVPFELLSEAHPVTGISILFERHCFQRSLRENPDVYILHENSTARVIGRTTAGTAEVYETQDGLVFSARPPQTQWWRDLQKSIERGDVVNAWVNIPRFTSHVETRLNKRVRVVEDAILRNVSISAFAPYSDETSITLDKKSSATMPLSLADAQARLRFARNSISEHDKEWLASMGVVGRRF